MTPQIAQPLTPDPGAQLDAIYREHVEYVWATLQRLGVAVADLEDVAHEVFVTVHRRSNEIDPARPLKPWLFGIALRLASRYRRSKQRRREVDVEVDVADDARGASGLLEQRDAQRVVFQALDQLSDEQRAVFVLHDLEGASAPEIATQLEVPLNTVYSRLRLARERVTATITRELGRQAKS